MSNRYCNLVPSKKISEDFQNISSGFDVVQNEIDAANTVATNHINSTSAHAAQNITYSGEVTGATQVKQALDSLDTRVDGIVGQAGTSNTEIVDARLGVTGTAHAVLKNRLDTMENRQIESALTAVSLRQGLQSITSTVTTPLDVNIRGRTLVNILGNDGNCESLAPFTTTGTTALSTTQKRSGSNSIRFAPTGLSDRATKDYTYPLNTTKQYVACGWVYIESYTSGSVVLRLQDVNTSTDRYLVFADTATIGAWQFIYIKIPTSNTFVGTGFRLYFGVGGTTPNSTSYFDDIRLYEVDTATYNAIGTTITATTVPSIDDVLPYVDNIKHVVNPSVSCVSDNLLPPFTQGWNMNVSATVVKPYEFRLLGPSGTSSDSAIAIPVIPNTNYFLSYTRTGGTGRTLITGNITGTILSLSSELNRSFNSGSNTQITITFNKLSSGTDLITFTNPHLVLGSTAPTIFMPYNASSVVASTTLAGDTVTGVYDELYQQDGEWRRLNRWARDVELTGALGWSSAVDYSGYKRAVTSFSLSFSSSNTGFVTKYNGASLAYANATDLVTGVGADRFGSASLNRIDLTIADTDSGWGETYAPTANEIKAYFYGYKMNDGNFGTAYNGTGTKTWTLWNASNNTGSVTTVPTTQAAGFTPYRLTYQLATPTTEAVTVTGSLMLGSGGNHVTVGQYSATDKYQVSANTITANAEYASNLGSVVAHSVRDIQEDTARSLHTSGIKPMTGQLATIAGTVGTPAIAPTGDSNTGVYFPAADTVALVTNGVERLRVDSAGVLLIANNTLKVQSGTGSPEGVVTAPVGSLFLRTDGSTSTTLYVKTSGTGNTGWTAK